MRKKGHQSGGSSGLVGYGLTGALFVFGWIVLGTMLLLNEIFGGAEIILPQREEGKQGA